MLQRLINYSRLNLVPRTEKFNISIFSPFAITYPSRKIHYFNFLEVANFAPLILRSSVGLRCPIGRHDQQQLNQHADFRFISDEEVVAWFSNNLMNSPSNSKNTGAACERHFWHEHPKLRQSRVVVLTNGKQEVVAREIERGNCNLR